MFSLYRKFLEKGPIAFSFFSFFLGVFLSYYVTVYLESSRLLASYIGINYFIIFSILFIISLHIPVNGKRYGILDRNYQYLINIGFLVMCFFLSILRQKEVMVLSLLPLSIGIMGVVAVNMYFWTKYVIDEIIEREDVDF